MNATLARQILALLAQGALDRPQLAALVLKDVPSSPVEELRTLTRVIWDVIADLVDSGLVAEEVTRGRRRLDLEVVLILTLTDAGRAELDRPSATRAPRPCARPDQGLARRIAA